MLALIVKEKRIIGSLLWRALLWHLRYFLKKEPGPLACELFITSKCNLRCQFCNIWRKNPPQTLPFDKAKRIVSDLGALGCFYLNIAGGEPLLVDYLSPLLTHARRNGIKYLHMVTNGYLLDRKTAVMLGETGMHDVAISIDGKKEYHDARRGVSGSYDRAVEAVMNVKRYAPHIKVVLNAIMSPAEPFECLHVVELAKALDLYVKFQPLNQHPVFNADNYCMISRSWSCKDDVQYVITRLRKEPRVINSGLFLDGISHFLFDKAKLPFYGLPCLFGYHHIEILEDGSVFPCLEGMGWRGGFKFENSLRDLMHSAEYRECVERLKACEGCQKAYYICYYEPRIVFPFHNLLNYILHGFQRTS